ncbi:50S ribosomal protein L21 [Chryseobacterium sp.]|uniref:50S ribosomal protein L21 n=1 Tax=Chryseobacterium sp. TaxID=1871047 RepID=UPI00260F4468|nr:50S ribosomal protein L21 [Chryseobacterium sp.]
MSRSGLRHVPASAPSDQARRSERLQAPPVPCRDGLCLWGCAGKVSFDKVLLTVNGSITVGAPAVSGITVDAEILDHVKADKVIVFKKKRRKGYKVKNGHRQSLTQIQITGITGFDEAKKPAKKTTKKVEAEDAE